MCYESEAKCRFTCGHSFCKECTKTWYMKGKCSCPMCRAPMCFRGIIEAKKVWRREKWEEVYLELVIKMFDELGDEYKDVLLQCLEVVQNRFEYVSQKYPKLTRDELNLVLCVTWIDIDYLLNGPQIKVHPEPRTFEKYLMVSKYEKKIQYMIRDHDTSTHADADAFGGWIRRGVDSRSYDDVLLHINRDFRSRNGVLWSGRGR